MRLQYYYFCPLPRTSTAEGKSACVWRRGGGSNMLAEWHSAEAKMPIGAFLESEAVLLERLQVLPVKNPAAEVYWPLWRQRTYWGTRLLWRGGSASACRRRSGRARAQLLGRKWLTSISSRPGGTWGTHRMAMSSTTDMFKLTGQTSGCRFNTVVACGAVRAFQDYQRHSLRTTA